MNTVLAIAVVALTLSGCDPMRAALTTLEDKVNTAFPLPEELVAAQNRLFADLETDAPAKQALSRNYAQLLSVRALACTTGTAIGRFDTPADIRKKVGSTPCFRDQDAALADWVGLRRFIQAVRKAPLVPLSPLPPRVAIASHEETAVGIVTASAANVAVIKGNRGKLTSVQLPSGKALASFSSPAQADRNGSLSPNGRVLALPISNTGLKLVDTESGTTLWSTEKYNQLLAWLPEVDATLLAQRGNSAPQLLDHRSAAAQPYAVPLQRLTWAVPVADTPARLVVGDYRGAAFVDHARDVDGALSMNVARQWQLTAHQGVTSLTPIVMNSGKLLVYVSGVDVAWLNTDSGAQGVWSFSAIGGQGYSKLSENILYLDARATGTRSEGRLFDVVQGTLTPAEGTSNDGLLLPLDARPGYARRGHPTVVVATTAAAQGEPQALDALIAQAQLAQQLAKLEPPAAVSDSGSSWHLGRYPGPTAAPPGRPLLADVPADAKVAVIGVYEATQPAVRGPQRRGGTIRITVAPGRQPLVLVLTSYEPVTWVVNDGGRKIPAILVSGYSPSTVVGTRSQVLKIGSTYAYKMDSAQYAQLKRDIARYVPNPVQSFQGGYAGQEFSVY